MCLSAPNLRRCTLSESTLPTFGGDNVRKFRLPGPLLRAARKEWPELSLEARRRVRIVDSLRHDG